MEGGWCTGRPLSIRLVDFFENEAIELCLPRVNLCSQPCWVHTMSVCAPPSVSIGGVEQECTLCFPSFAVKNSNNETVLRLEGPLFYSPCGYSKFNIISINGVKIGKISIRSRESFRYSEYFRVSFALDMDVKIKAVLLGAGFLVVISFFSFYTVRT